MTQFLRFGVGPGWVSERVAASLSQPKYMRFLPAGVGGEGRDLRVVQERTLRFATTDPGIECFTPEQVELMIRLARNARDRFMIVLMRATGMRIGEMLGLHRADMHLLADSHALGCAVRGPHVHVRRRRDNTNGALAKSRKPRAIPVGDVVVGHYRDYQWERDAVSEAADSDMVFVNLFRAPLGRAMSYPNAKQLFAITAWQKMRDRFEAPSVSDSYLFPAITDNSGFDHLTSNNFSAGHRAWVDSLPSLDSDALDADGNIIPFDRSLIFPYAFRHSFAQRHADAGTPIDVLRDLMDHDDPKTTMGYYRVSFERKRQAVKSLSLMVVDRHGGLVPCSSRAYEKRSVAVPFGGCTEPSNIKAGGQSCPIRFQCSGCGFYRPDPSYLPAIEDHANSLRADRERAMAMDAASFVIDNLTAQITSYEDVATKMRERMAALPEDERSELEDAAAVLRRVRAGGDHKLLPLTEVSKTGK